jgi:hypothetical protein
MRAPSGESQAAWLSGKPPEERISDVARGRNKPRKTEEEQTVESGRNAEDGTKIGVGHRSSVDFSVDVAKESETPGEEIRLREQSNRYGGRWL